MSHDITYCNNRKCHRTDCLRYYKHAPFDVLLSWSNFNDKKDLERKTCEHYLEK